MEWTFKYLPTNHVLGNHRTKTQRNNSNNKQPHTSSYKRSPPLFCEFNQKLTCKTHYCTRARLYYLSQALPDIPTWWVSTMIWAVLINIFLYTHMYEIYRHFNISFFPWWTKFSIFCKKNTILKFRLVQNIVYFLYNSVLCVFLICWQLRIIIGVVLVWDPHVDWSVQYICVIYHFQ